MNMTLNRPWRPAEREPGFHRMLEFVQLSEEEKLLVTEGD